MQCGPKECQQYIALMHTGSLNAENYNNDVNYILWPSQSLSLIHEEFHPFS